MYRTEVNGIFCFFYKIWLPCQYPTAPLKLLSLSEFRDQKTYPLNTNVEGSLHIYRTEVMTQFIAILAYFPKIQVAHLNSLTPKILPVMPKCFNILKF